MLVTELPQIEFELNVDSDGTIYGRLFIPGCCLGTGKVQGKLLSDSDQTRVYCPINKQNHYRVIEFLSTAQEYLRCYLEYAPSHKYSTRTHLLIEQLLTNTEHSHPEDVEPSVKLELESIDLWDVPVEVVEEEELAETDLSDEDFALISSYYAPIPVLDGLATKDSLKQQKRLFLKHLATVHRIPGRSKLTSVKKLVEALKAEVKVSELVYA